MPKYTNKQPTITKNIGRHLIDEMVSGAASD